MCNNSLARERLAATAIAPLRIPRRARTLKSQKSRHYEAMPHGNTPASGAAIPPAMPDSGIQTWAGGFRAYPALVRRVPPR